MSGATTPDGIVYMTAGDDITPIETHFAALAGTAQDAIAALRAELAATQAPVTVTQGQFGVVQSGITVQFFSARRVGKVISGTMRVTKASAFTHGQAVMRVNLAFRPIVDQTLPLPAIHSGGGSSAGAGGVALEADGDIIMLSPGTSTVAEIALTWIIQ